MDAKTCVLPVSVILGLLLPACLRGQGASPGRPVPPELIKGGELVVESGNFAIATPAGQWQWSFTEDHRTPPPQETYICTEDESGAMFSVVVMHTRFPPGDRFVAEFQKGLQKSLAATGWTVASMEMAESSVPVPDSYRCQWCASRPDGTPMYGYAYVVTAEASYTLKHATPESSEPPAFAAFASTFRLLDGGRPPVGPNPMVLIYILVVGLPCGGAAIANRASGRVILNGGTIAAALVIVVMIAAIAIESYASVSAGLPPEQLGPIAGYRVGQTFLPLLAAVIVSHIVRRRKARERTTA